MMAERLTEHDDHGRMIELPCALGDTIYHLCKCDDGRFPEERVKGKTKRWL